MALATSQYSVDFAVGTLQQFFSLIDQHRPVHFAMTAHVEGRTSISAWRTALDALQERHPLLSVSIDRTKGALPRFRAHLDAPIPLRVTASPDHANWQLEVAKELANRFDEEQAPLMRAVLCHGNSESIFILTAHHSIADGLSLTYAIRDVLRALSGKALEPLPPTPPLELLVELLQRPHHNAKHPPSDAAPQEGRPVAFRALNGTLPAIDALCLTPELTGRLIQLSQQERTTIHGALCAALVLAGRQYSSKWRSSPVRILSPFNLRKQIGIDEDCGVFVWAATIPIEPHTGADFWQIARAAGFSFTGQQTREHVTRGMATLGEALTPDIDVQGALQILAQTFPCEMLLTNLGNVPCQFDCGDLKLKALWGPAAFMGFEGEQTVGVTTTNGSLCLLHCSFTPLPSLLDRTERILRAVCEAEAPVDQTLLRKMPVTMIECGNRCRIQG